MAAPGLSTSTNPFRKPHLTPQNTNQSSSAPPAVAAPPHPQRTATLLSEGIPDDAPPAYTPSANSHQGEASVEFGPRRPFQQAPPPSVIVGPQHTGASSQAYPPPQSLASVFSPPLGRPPPPRHPSIASAPSATQTFSPPPGQPPPSSQRSQTPPQRFAPPSGSPPRRAVSTSHLGPSTDLNGVPDDGRPTTTPVPGHPLLHSGRLLVYPIGYACPKCSNTGYKNYDPSHPCRKCWERFAQPYAGALVHAPATPASSLGPNGNFQRPLPNFRPPHLNHSSGYPNVRSAPLPAPPPTTVFAQSFGPPPGATVVLPGDPRIGGRLCWRCGGRGSVSVMIFDRETCDMCRGAGRVFN